MGSITKVLIFLVVAFLSVVLITGAVFLLKNTNTKSENINITSSPPLIVAVGDIQCNETLLGPANCASIEEASMAKQLNPSAILLLGDEQYGKGQLSDFEDTIGPSWAGQIEKIYPIVGNHDYLSRGASGFFKYFKGKNPKISLQKSFYSYDVGSWHLIALDTNCSYVDGCTPASTEYKWLENDLANIKNKCVLAYFHQPLFSSGIHGNNLQSKNFWDLLYKYKADVVLNGHEHVYERFAPQDPDGRPDQKNGITQFIVGTGGGNLYKFAQVKPNSLARNNQSYGFLSLTLSEGKYSWKFVSIEENGFTDEGQASCQ